MVPQANVKIVFVPGVKPKPQPALHQDALLRCLRKGLERAVPDAFELLSHHPEIFELYAWNFLAYQQYRDINLDSEGIERLIESPVPTEADRRAIESSARRTSRLTHLIGDRFPPLGRLFAPDRLRESLSDARGYLRDIRGLGTRIRGGLKDMLIDSWSSGYRVILIGHSLGSVIAYDALWELSRETSSARSIDLFVTLGSPLATRFVSPLIKGVGEQGKRRYPTNIRKWMNFSALGETVQFFPPLAAQFGEMITLGLIDSLTDRFGLYNHFRGDRGLNVHVSYGYLVNEEVARVIGNALLDRADGIHAGDRVEPA